MLLGVPLLGVSLQDFIKIKKFGIIQLIKILMTKAVYCSALCVDTSFEFIYYVIKYRVFRFYSDKLS